MYLKQIIQKEDSDEYIIGIKRYVYDYTKYINEIISFRNLMIIK